MKKQKNSFRKQLGKLAVVLSLAIMLTGSLKVNATEVTSETVQITIDNTNSHVGVRFYADSANIETLDEARDFTWIDPGTSETITTTKDVTARIRLYIRADGYYVPEDYVISGTTKLTNDGGVVGYCKAAFEIAADTTKTIVIPAATECTHPYFNPDVRWGYYDCGDGTHIQNCTVCYATIASTKANHTLSEMTATEYVDWYYADDNFAGIPAGEIAAWKADFINIITAELGVDANTKCNFCNKCEHWEMIKPSGATTINGAPVTMEVVTVESVKDALPAPQKAKIEEVLAVVDSGDTGAIAGMQKALIEEVTSEEVEVIKFAKLVDVALPTGNSIPAGGSIDVTFTDSNIKAGMNIVMLHLKADGTWENIPVTVTDGVIVGTFTSLSPIYYFALEAAPVVNTSYTPAEIGFQAADGTAMRWISSNNNGNISVFAAESVLPQGASFQATRTQSGDVYDRAAKAVASKFGAANFAVYEMNLFDANGNELKKFSKNMTVGMPIPSGLSTADGKTVCVYYLNNNKLEKCYTAVEDGFVNFATSHFSTFVYVEQDATSAGVKSPKTGESNVPYMMALIAMISLVGAVYGTKKVYMK